MSLKYDKKLGFANPKISRSHKIYIDCKDKLSIFVVEASRPIEKPQRSNNVKNVLDVLNNKFNSFRNGSRKDLPDEAVGDVVKRMLHVDTLINFIHSTERPAIITPPTHTKPTTKNHITHNEIRSFIEKSFNLAKFNLWCGDRVAICLPEGPVLNLCLLSTMAYCTCVPSNSKLTPDELLNDYNQMNVKAVIVPYARLITSKNDPLILRLREAGFKLIGLKTANETDITFTLVNDPNCFKNNANNENTRDITVQPPLNEANNVVMLIQTSGTTGQKKMVPYRLQTLCISTVCVIFSLDVKDTDTIINMMPLFHVGGIIRNLLTPVFTGGSIIQCQGFDPVLFCDILDNQTNPIWFYGVPSMQQNIIQVASMRKLSSKSCDLVKKVCNAGAALAPSLAKEIKSVFTQATILPSYGMTECMPICAPPLNYALELEGTSGQILGPELAIFVDDGITHEENIIGNILVRGGPCFDGYEGVDKTEIFDKNGYFDTGDMGYLKKGYLYITGRSKEVINRGGEILSPLEIENILITHPKVGQVMVFSVPHDTLQETVGCAIVTSDSHSRPDLRALRKFLDKKLHSTKHPQLLVYTNEIPKSNVGKVLRINFSNRLNIPIITNATELASPSGLLYEAQFTKTNGSSFKVVSFGAVEWSVNDVVDIVRRHSHVKACAGHRNGGKFFLFIVKATDDVDDNELALNVENHLRSNVHDYMLPTDVVVVQEHMLTDGESVDERKLSNLLQRQQEGNDDAVTLALCDLFRLAIGVTNNESSNKFPVDGNFFEYGGNSLKTGFLISTIRTKLGVTMPVTTLYEEDCQTPAGLAVRCRELIPKDHILLTRGYDGFRKKDNQTDENETYHQSNYKKRMKSRPLSGAKNPLNPLTILLQASPFYLIQPFAHIFRWIIFVNVLLLMSAIRRETSIAIPNLLWLLSALLITGTILSVVFPLIGILMKWLVIGRYRAGTYSLWGVYYLRWWFINKLLLVMGAGIFKLSPTLFAFYLRLMGAKVGRNSRISCDAVIEEYDLINIGSDCYVDGCVIRPFRLSRGHMNLSNIVIGDGCVIAFRTNVVAGSTLPNGTVIGPQTTTYTRDVQCNGSSAHIDTAEGKKLRDLCKETIPPPHLMLEYLVGWPIVISAQIVSHIPWFCCIYLLTMEKSWTGGSSCSRTMAEFILYFSRPSRLGYFLLATCVRRYVVHLLYFMLVIVIKRLVIGKFEAGPRKLDQLSLLRHWLMKTLLSKEKWQLVSTIVGSHYECISIIYRLLGAKVGKRVYWPGTNINLIEFDLLTVGDDVIFGSRSHILCGDAKECAPVTLDDGAMCADNCVILPGSRIGRNAILGSGGLLQKHFTLPNDSIWYGSFNGNAVKLRNGSTQKNMSTDLVVKEKDETTGASTETIVSIGKYENDTKRPFGRAFYERKANYYVFPLPIIVFYNWIITCVGSILWTIPILSALQITSIYLRTAEVLSNQGTALFVLVIFCSFSISYVLISVFVSFLEIVAKWILLGRRKPGTYNWDTSSYCQRWQILISIQLIGRKNALSFMGGSAWIVLFFRALGCTIGKRVCLYPNGGDPVMSEPDLVRLEDDVAVDKASLICHINTLGEFSINPLWVGAGSVLQNDSRLASGASMLEDCTLLDRSYIIQGEVAEAGSVWQGYPSVSTSFEEQNSLYARSSKL